MRCRRKFLFNCLGFLLPVIIIIIVLYKLNKCYIPVTVMKLYKTPVRLDNICHSGTKFESIYKSYKNESKLGIDVPRYVALKRIQGRLGNQMFQTAAIYGIAATLGYKPYIDQAHPLLPYFEIRPPKPVSLTNTVDLSEEECVHGAWRCRQDIYSHNITVTGFLQSQKYFRHIAPTIRKMYKIKPYYRQQAKEFMDEFKSKNRTIIGIHVRRGDFDVSDLRSCGFTMATSNFFQNAMHMYRKDLKNVLFIVMSDDMTWCKENIVGDDVIYSSFVHPIKDLALMSMCDNMIITGGTFGFWGAWLSGGKVIYLNDWPRPGSWLDIYGMIKEDFWSPDWIGISNSASEILKSISLIAFLMHLPIFSLPII